MPEKRKSWTLRISILVLIILLLLLLMRGCPGPEGDFDYFAHQASELGNDPARVEAFVRDDVETLPYEGSVKGALGALWGRAGSKDEKALLLNALLKHCDEADDPPDVKAYFLTLTHESDKATKIFHGPIAHLVGAVHTVATSREGETTITLRADDGDKSTTVAAGRSGERIVFTVERPGAAPLTVARELWHPKNRVGLDSTQVGDRHDFVVLPCRMTAFVKEKEQVILEQRGEAEADHAHPYDGLLEYALAADELLADLEKNFKVRAQFDQPRILILSTLKRTDDDEKSHAFDLRLNYTSFTGDEIEAYKAAQVRSLLESGLEHEFLMNWTKTGGNSAFDTFNRLHDEYPNRFDRRVQAIHDALIALRKHGGGGARAVFRAKDHVGAEVAAEWKDGKVHVNGGALRAGFAEALAKREGAPKLEGPFDAAEAAAAIETMLLAADVNPSVSPNYTLESDIGMGGEPLVVPSARFTFAWGEGNDKTRQFVQVRECKSGLEYTFHTRRGLKTAAGQLAVDAQAVASATHHNPHYRSGNHVQADATSFCVSRRVYDALKKGERTPFALRAQFKKADDPKAPRPVAWEGELVPSGSREHEVEVNGKPIKVALLVATLEGGTPPFAEVTVLDDARWPVGRADALTSIQTSARGRLLDENGLGIGRALVSAGEGEGAPSTITWPDGRFRLPPPKEGESPGKITLVVKQKLGEEEFVETLDLDLSAPGLDEFDIEVKRARNKVVWITPKQEAELDKLKGLSDQIKRHARIHLQAQRIVIMPERTLRDGLVGLAAFYAFDPTTGHSIGVTEDGLHGSMANWYSYTRATGKATGKALDAMVLGDGYGGMAPVHVMRGANTAMFMFATYRLQGKGAGEAAGQLLSEMEMWEARTNLFSNIEEAAGGKVADFYRDKLGAGRKNVDGDGAKAAFYIGYIVATGYLHNKQK